MYRNSTRNQLMPTLTRIPKTRISVNGRQATMVYLS